MPPRRYASPTFTVSLQQARTINILQNNPFVAQPVLNPGSSPDLEAISLAQVNLKREGNAVLQADENPTQAPVRFDKSGAALEACCLRV